LADFSPFLKEVSLKTMRTVRKDKKNSALMNARASGTGVAVVSRWSLQLHLGSAH
jgi:hypothetical protein